MDTYLRDGNGFSRGGFPLLHVTEREGDVGVMGLLTDAADVSLTDCSPKTVGTINGP